MNDATSPSTPGDGGVPATPVVQIEIFGSTISVNGVVIIHDGTQSPHSVAVKAAAERVAKPLGLPVRAVAADAEGRASMVIHPDGSATDVELLDDDEVAAAPVVAPAVASAAVMAPAAAYAGGVAAPDDTSILPIGPPPSYAPPAIRTPGETRPAAGASQGLSSKVVRAVAVAVALVAVAGLGVLLLSNRSSDDQAQDRSGTTSPVAASSEKPTTPEPTGTTGSADGVPTISVSALPGPNALRLTVTSDTYPATATVTVTDVAGTVVTNTLAIAGPTSEIELDELAAGAATWTVKVPGAKAQTGQVTVAAPYAPVPLPTAVPTPATPAAPAVPATPKTHHQKHQDKPAKPKAKPKPKPKGKSGLKPKTGFGKPKKRG